MTQRNLNLASRFRLEIWCLALATSMLLQMPTHGVSENSRSSVETNTRRETGASSPAAPVFPDPTRVAVVQSASATRGGAGAPAFDFPAYLTDGVLTSSYQGLFGVPPDADPYDQIPYQSYSLCVQRKTDFDIQPLCDNVSFVEAFGNSNGIVYFPEALDPLRGQEVMVWIQAVNTLTNQFDVSYARRMRVPLSNVALKPPGSESLEPFLQVFPSRISASFDTLEGWSFRWPLQTTGLAAPWGGINDTATKHVLTIQLTQSSATCERTKFACPGPGNVCSDTDPLACSAGERGYCTYTEPCSSIAPLKSYEIPLGSLTTSLTDVGEGSARINNSAGTEGFTYVEFFPDVESYEGLFDVVTPDKIIWNVATCSPISTSAPEGIVTVCGNTEFGFTHHAVGTIGFVGDGGDPGGGGLPQLGIAFANSPLVDTFSHSACINCHVLERDGTAVPPVGRGAAHLGFIGGNADNFDNPASCAGCHSSSLAPPILGTGYSNFHGLDDAFPGEDYDAWWAWFAPEWEGNLEWPELLGDPAGPDFDPATACVKFRGENPDAASMKHHLFEDPRVLWSIIGGDKPNNNFVDELAPPGTGLTANSSLSDQLNTLSIWEDWVNEWVDGGMVCGTTVTGSSAGGGGNEPVNTTPPTTTSDGSSGTWVGGEMGSNQTTIAHLDCDPDQDSSSASCAWTFFACGSNEVVVEDQISTCTEQNAVPYLQASVNPVGLCDVAASGCYGFEPGVGGSTYWSLVQIPGEVGDHTRLSFFSLDAENNKEVVRSEAYDFVEADLLAPNSSAELYYDIDDDEHKLRFSCEDNSETCMIFYKANSPGQELTPEFDMSTQLLNSGGGAFNSDGNTLGFLGTTQVKRIRWAAIDGAAGQKNAEFDGLCFEDQLELCPGKLALQNQCVSTCEAGIRSTCETTCGGSPGSGGIEEECVNTCVADSPTDCMLGCEQTCDITNTVCPGDDPSFGETGCISRVNPIQCYHEFVYDPFIFYDTDPPEARALPLSEAAAGGTYDAAFNLALLCDDPVNPCKIYYTEDGSEPTADPRLLYNEALAILGPIQGRTATTTIKYFAQDNAVPPNSSSMETLTYTIVLPHTDDDGDGFTEDQGDCNDDNIDIFPFAPEVCNFIDDNCNGVIDEVDSGPACPTSSIFSDGFQSGSTSAWQ